MISYAKMCHQRGVPAPSNQVFNSEAQKQEIAASPLVAEVAPESSLLITASKRLPSIGPWLQAVQSMSFDIPRCPQYFHCTSQVCSPWTSSPPWTPSVLSPSLDGVAQFLEPPRGRDGTSVRHVFASWPRNVWPPCSERNFGGEMSSSWWKERRPRSYMS